MREGTDHPRRQHDRPLSGWPEDVVVYYRDLAERRGWPASVAAAFGQSVDYYRHLAEGGGERTYWRGIDPDWVQILFEAVADVDASFVPVRQVIVEVDSTRRRYSWRRLEDDDGGLVERSLDESITNLEAIREDEFEAAWALD